MSYSERHTEESLRATLQLQAWEQIEGLDDEGLARLNGWLGDADKAPRAASRGITRRELLMSSGLALLGLGTGLGSRALTKPRTTAPSPGATAPTASSGSVAPAPTPFPDMSARVAELEAQTNTLTGSLDESNALLDLYRQLDAILIDETVATGTAAVVVVANGIATQADALRTGLRSAKEKIAELDQAFSGLDGALARVETTVSATSGAVQALENGLRAAGEPVRPMTDALGAFFRNVVARIPGVGDEIIEAIDRVEAVVGSVPELIESINGELVTPMRDRFFPSDPAEENVRVRLLDPLVDLVFLPADSLLGKVADLGTTIQESLSNPVEAQIKQRSEIREKLKALEDGER